MRAPSERSKDSERTSHGGERSRSKRTLPRTNAEKPQEPLFPAERAPPGWLGPPCATRVDALGQGLGEPCGLQPAHMALSPGRPHPSPRAPSWLPQRQPPCSPQRAAWPAAGLSPFLNRRSSPTTMSEWNCLQPLVRPPSCPWCRGTQPGPLTASARPEEPPLLILSPIPRDAYSVGGGPGVSVFKIPPDSRAQSGLRSLCYLNKT